MRNTLHKSERLSGESRIGALFGEGQRGGVFPLRFSFLTETLLLREGGVPSQSEGEVVGRLNPGVSVLFSVPKKFYKRAWKRNLIKRRMRESYRARKHALLAAATAAGKQLDIALICTPPLPRKGEVVASKWKKAPTPPPEIPDFKTIDNAIAQILDKILARL